MNAVGREPSAPGRMSASSDVPATGGSLRSRRAAATTCRIRLYSMNFRIEAWSA